MDIRPAEVAGHFDRLQHQLALIDTSASQICAIGLIEETKPWELAKRRRRTTRAKARSRRRPLHPRRVPPHHRHPPLPRDAEGGAWDLRSARLEARRVRPFAAFPSRRREVGRPARWPPPRQAHPALPAPRGRACHVGDLNKAARGRAALQSAAREKRDAPPFSRAQRALECGASSRRFFHPCVARDRDDARKPFL